MNFKKIVIFACLITAPLVFPAEDQEKLAGVMNLYPMVELLDYVKSSMNTDDINTLDEKAMNEVIENAARRIEAKEKHPDFYSQGIGLSIKTILCYEIDNNITLMKYFILTMQNKGMKVNWCELAFTCKSEQMWEQLLNLCSDQDRESIYAYGLTPENVKKLVQRKKELLKLHPKKIAATDQQDNNLSAHDNHQSSHDNDEPVNNLPDNSNHQSREAFSLSPVIGGFIGVVGLGAMCYWWTQRKNTSDKSQCV